jgi:hypothetical protein
VPSRGRFGRHREASRFCACLVTKRFSSYRELGPKDMIAGGSREPPSVWLLSTLAKIDLRCERTAVKRSRSIVSGSRLLPYVSVAQMIEIIRRVIASMPKRLARRSFPESKRRGEVCLPSRVPTESDSSRGRGKAAPQVPGIIVSLFTSALR